MNGSWSSWRAMVGLLATGIVLLYSGSFCLLHAAVPHTIHYQGKLTQPDGSALTGDHSVTLRLYTVATGGTKLWEEQHDLHLVRDDNGVFSVILGSTTPFSSAITFNDPLWLSIEVDGGGEFSPRQPLSAVSYAINADMLNGMTSTQLLASVAGTGGGITGVTAGAGLTGGGTSGNVTLDVGAGAGLVVSADAISVDVGTTAGKIVQLDATGALPAVSGATLTNLNASALTSGTVPDARLSANVSLLGQSIESSEVTPGTLVASNTADNFLVAGVGVTVTKGATSWTLSAVGAGGDVTAVGDCSAGACFTSSGTGTSLTFHGTTSGTMTLNAPATASGTLTLPAVTGNLITTGNLSDIAGTGTLTSGATGAGFTINLSTSTVSGTLGPTNGGTGLTSYNPGDLLYASAANTLSRLAAGTAGQVLKMQASNVPAWDADLTSGGTVTSITASGGLTASPNPITSTGTISLATGGVTTTTLADSAVTSAKIADGTIVDADISASAAIDWSKISTAANKVNLTTQVTGALPVANGGTGASTATAAFDALSPLTTLGDLLYHNGTNDVRLGGNTAATKKFLAQTGTGAASAAPAWATLAVSDLPAHAGTHQPGGTDALPTASAVSIGAANGAGTSTSLARADHTHQGLHSIAASGQPQLVGDATLAAGANISLSQAGQTITIAAPSGNKATTFASSAVTIDTASDTTLATATITKSQASSALLVIATVQLSHTANPNTKTVDVKLFRDATQLDANYTARIGTANGAVRNIPVTLHTWDASGAGTHTFTCSARASAAGVQASVRRLTVIELL